MIANLNIKNIALIQELSLELHKGLNVLSGETGAGKSIIIDSINFVLGDRADRSLIRYGETFARVEVVFNDINNFESIEKILVDFGIDYDFGTLIISRTMTNEKSECRVNGRQVTLATLRSMVGLLVDIHSQNEHQSILKINNHQHILDAFCPELEGIMEHYVSDYTKLRDISKKLQEFSTSQDRERKIDILSFQLEEIEGANIKEGEYEELTSKKNKYHNAQKIMNAITDSIRYISGDDILGGLPSIRQAYNQLKGALRFDESLAEYLDRLDSVIIELSDVVSSLEGAFEIDEIQNIDINALEKRIDLIKSVKRKYGATLDEINDFAEKARKELDYLSNIEITILELERESIELRESLVEKAKKIHKIRVHNSKKFADDITNNLVDLGMKNSVFVVKVELAEDVDKGLTINGADNIEFLLSPNLGEPPKQLVKIASGGEMSRFMLALKNIIAEVDGIDTLIFDEIDTGISGVIAKVVAMKLFDIAKSRQVIAITHLPQLASMADYNYLIEKQVVEEEKTLTFVKELDDNAVFSEIMRLSGAVENSEIGLSSAKELKEWANKYKLN